nr:J protein JJJ2 [Ipomoea batatas]
MGRSRNDSSADTKKSQLVIDICNVSLRASSCDHRHNHHRFRPEKPGFVDWYLAYVCLADDVRRAGFDVQRQSSFCNECCNNPYLNSKPPPQAKVVKSRNVSQIVRELKARFSQEATVIQKCVKMNANARTRRDEYPIFNPSDYVFHGYPHHRNQSRVQSVGRNNQSPVFEHRIERAQKCVGD